MESVRFSTALCYLRRGLCLSILVLALAVGTPSIVAQAAQSGTGSGTGKAKGTATPRPPQVERITDNLYRVGKVMVDLAGRTVTCPATLNMDSGAIEYIAVAPNGKTHESLLEVDVRPIHLQIALLLLDLQPKNVLKAQGDPATPQGAPVDLYVRWKDAHGVEQEARVEEWVLELPSSGSTSQHNPQPKLMSNHAWVFTGSKVVPEGFVADLERSLVAVWHDPAAILDNPRPDGANNAHIVNTRLTGSKQVPKRGTPVTFIIKAAPQATEMPK